MDIAIFAAVWMICGLIGAGALTADWEHNFGEDKQTRRVMMGIGIVSGPIGLILGVVGSGFFYHGWKWPW